MPTAEGLWPTPVVAGEVPPPHGWPAAHPGKKFFPKKFGGVGETFLTYNTIMCSRKLKIMLPIVLHNKIC